MQAFQKLEKREHLLRVTRERMALGRITREVFRKEEAAILEKYKLTFDEERAYNQHIKNSKRQSK
jgi:hypothetical protein